MVNLDKCISTTTAFEISKDTKNNVKDAIKNAYARIITRHELNDIQKQTLKEGIVRQFGNADFDIAIKNPSLQVLNEGWFNRLQKPSDIVFTDTITIPKSKIRIWYSPSTGGSKKHALVARIRHIAGDNPPKVIFEDWSFIAGDNVHLDAELTAEEGSNQFIFELMSFDQQVLETFNINLTYKP